MNPPLREPADVDAMIEGIVDGIGRCDRDRSRAASRRREGRRVRPGAVRHRRARDVRAARRSSGSCTLAASRWAAPSSCSRRIRRGFSGGPAGRSRRAPSPTSPCSRRTRAVTVVASKLVSRSKNTPFDGWTLRGVDRRDDRRRAGRSTPIPTSPARPSSPEDQRDENRRHQGARARTSCGGSKC